MPNDIKIVDVWTQWFSPTPPEKRKAEAENVFRNYGRLEWYYNGTDPVRMLEEMDAAGVEVACMSGDPENIREAIRKYPKRFIGEYHADPTNIMRAVRGLQEYVEKYGFKVCRVEPFLYDRPPTHPCYYPLYAKCVELDVPFQTQVGHTGPLYTSETGRPLYIDRVALDFPELRIICGHIGWPWTEEMIAVAWKHANVYIDTSAHFPKRYGDALIKWMKGPLKSKVLFATDYPLLPYDRVMKEVNELGLPEDVRQMFLRDNARRVLKLDL